MKYQTKLLKTGTSTELVACEYITINEQGEVIAYENEKKQVEALRFDKSLKGYIVKTYTVNTTTEIKAKEN